MACVPEAKKGDFVIVHAGIAISRINPEEAQRVLNYLKQIGENDGWDRGLSPNHGDRQQQYAS
jgi:hydrogenase maturation factor